MGTLERTRAEPNKLVKKTKLDWLCLVNCFPLSTDGDPYNLLFRASLGRPNAQIFKEVSIFPSLSCSLCLLLSLSLCLPFSLPFNLFCLWPCVKEKQRRTEVMVDKAESSSSESPSSHPFSMAASMLKLMPSTVAVMRTSV